MSSSAEEDLDAAIWRALQVYKVTCAEPLMLVESLTIAARAYAASDSDLLTQARRMVLHEASRPRRRTRAELRPESASTPAPEPNPPGSGAMPTSGATLSTGSSVPVAGKDRVNLRPQAVDRFGPDIHSSRDLSYSQAAKALQELA